MPRAISARGATYWLHLSCRIRINTTNVSVTRFRCLFERKYLCIQAANQLMRKMRLDWNGILLRRDVHLLQTPDGPIESI